MVGRDVYHFLVREVYMQLMNLEETNNRETLIMKLEGDALEKQLLEALKTLNAFNDNEVLNEIYNTVVTSQIHEVDNIQYTLVIAPILELAKHSNYTLTIEDFKDNDLYIKSYLAKNNLSMDYTVSLRDYVDYLDDACQVIKLLGTFDDRAKLLVKYIKKIPESQQGLCKDLTLQDIQILIKVGIFKIDKFKMFSQMQEYKNLKDDEKKSKLMCKLLGRDDIYLSAKLFNSIAYSEVDINTIRDKIPNLQLLDRNPWNWIFINGDIPFLIPDYLFDNDEVISLLPTGKLIAFTQRDVLIITQPAKDVPQIDVPTYTHVLWKGNLMNSLILANLPLCPTIFRVFNAIDNGALDYREVATNIDLLHAISIFVREDDNFMSALFRLLLAQNNMPWSTKISLSLQQEVKVSNEVYHLGSSELNERLKGEKFSYSIKENQVQINTGGF